MDQRTFVHIFISRNCKLIRSNLVSQFSIHQNEKKISDETDSTFLNPAGAGFKVICYSKSGSSSVAEARFNCFTLSKEL